MATVSDKTPSASERDEPIKINLPFREAIDGLLRVDPDAPLADEGDDERASVRDDVE